jgi:hypothetical protein
MSKQKSFLARLFSRKPTQAVLSLSPSTPDLPPAEKPAAAKESTAKRAPSYYIPTDRSPWTVICWSRIHSRWEWSERLFHTRADARSYAGSVAFHPSVTTRVVRAIIPTR